MRMFMLAVALFAGAPSAFAADLLCGDIRISQKTGLAAWRTVYEGVVRGDDPMEVVLNYRLGDSSGPRVALTVEMRPALLDSGDGLELNVFRSVDVDGRSHFARAGAGTTHLRRGDLGRTSVGIRYRLGGQFQIFSVAMSNVHFCD